MVFKKHGIILEHLQKRVRAWPVNFVGSHNQLDLGPGWHGGCLVLVLPHLVIELPHSSNNVRPLGFPLCINWESEWRKQRG
jgi:hypothetical protein